MPPVAIITGSAQGIGRRTAEFFAESGYTLALVDLQPCTATLASIAGDTPAANALSFQGDLTDEDFISHLTTEVQSRFGHIDVLVNNAGISSIAPAEHTSAATFRRVLDVNLVAPFLLAKSVGTLMLAAHSGAIVNVASVAGLLGIGDRSAYNASKHGLIGLTRTLAAEWGGRGVRINAVCPGWVKTEMDHADQASSAYTDDDITGRVPMARFASPDDIARAILFLADPVQSSFINGQALPVDGGWTTDGSWQSLRLRHR